MQKLILPINRAVLTASWRTAAYRAQYGFEHYGIDLIAQDGAASGKRTVYASGTGIVVTTGRDSVVGNVVVVQYGNASNHHLGCAENVVLRYFHLNSIAVRPGQEVSKDTILGEYGNTGALTMGKHLHLEADTDTAAPLYSPTVYSSSLLRGRVLGATVTTMRNPLEYLYCKVSAPDNQTWVATIGSFIRLQDRALPSA